MHTHAHKVTISLAKVIHHYYHHRCHHRHHCLCPKQHHSRKTFIRKRFSCEVAMMLVVAVEMSYHSTVMIIKI